MNQANHYRCPWAANDPLYIQYHDEEWGVPEYEGEKLFAKLILDGAQAGLSWITILRKREGYYAAFDQFDPERIAGYDGRDIRRLMSNPAIVRNRLKIEAAITNARAYLKLEESGSDFSQFLWQFVDGRPIQNQWEELSELPTATAESKTMSQALKKTGFKFVGPTICYAFMQAVGMVNDHLVHCFRHQQLKKDLDEST